MNALKNKLQNKNADVFAMETEKSSKKLTLPANESTGLELLLNAAEACLQIILSDNGKLIYAGQWHKPERATEILASALKSIFASLDLSVVQLRRIGCIKGPGSFTGIRLTLATAAGLRRACQAKVGGMDYLQALATSVAVQRGLLYGNTVWVITHAKRNLVHCQPFVSYGPEIPAQPLDKVILCTPDLAMSRILEMPGHVCGSGIGRYPEKFHVADHDTNDYAERSFRHGIVLMPDLADPDIRAMLLLGRHADYFSDDLLPLYVRECDAIDNLPELAQKHGRDVKKTVETLEQFVCTDPEKDISID